MYPAPVRRGIRSVVSTRFSFHSKDRTFIADRSDFKDLGDVLDQAVYEDAADHGFMLESANTGIPALFVYYGARHDQGELYAWVYKPAPETIRRIPHLEGVVVIIFND